MKSAKPETRESNVGHHVAMVAVLCLGALAATVLYYSTSRIAEMDLHRKQVINSLFEAVIICDEDGKPVFVSDNIQDLFGYSTQEIYDGGVDQLMSESARSSHSAAYARSVKEVKNRYLYATTPTRRVIHVVCKDGTRRDCAIRMLSELVGSKVFMYAFIMPCDFNDTVKDWKRATD